MFLSTEEHLLVCYLDIFKQ